MIIHTLFGLDILENDRLENGVRQNCFVVES